MASSKEEILALSVHELPKGTVKEQGIEVDVQALKGADRLRVSSIQLLDERVLFALPLGCVEPKYSESEALELMNGNPKLACDILTKILELSSALGKAETEEAKVAESDL